jgi:uncharacterized protein (TIGR00369 family)
VRANTTPDQPVPPRQRLVTWDDPMASARRAREVDGLTFLRAVASGEMPAPPIARLLGFDGVEADSGRVVFACVPAEYHFNPIGVVHGGLAMTLLDSAMGCAVHTTLPVGAAYTTLEIKVNLVRPITLETGPVRCEGRVVHRGTTVATAEGRVTRERDGKLLAHATTTCLLFGPRGDAGVRPAGAAPPA